MLSHITGLIDSGADVDIFARLQPTDRLRHPSVDQYKLLLRTTYFSRDQSTRSRLARYVSYLATAFRCFGRSPGKALKAVNFTEFGLAGSLELLSALDVLLKKRIDYDIVHAHFGPVGILAQRLMDLGVFGKAKLITSFHGYDATKYVQRFGPQPYSRLFKRGHLFFTNSLQRKQTLVALGCSKEKVIVVPMGVHIPEHPKPADSLPNSARVLSIARLVPVKGLEFGIRAIARVRSNYPHVRYTIIGDGPLREELGQLVKDLKLDENVTFSGSRTMPEIEAALKETDVLLSPSVTPSEGGTEGMIVANMEAMARGIPVVSSNHGGIPELVEHGVSGLLCEERDTEGLANALIRLMADPKLRESMGEAARVRVAQRHDQLQLNKRVIQIYESLLSRW